MANYFDELTVSSAVREFQATHDSSVINPYTKQFQDLIKGVINRHQIHRFWDNTAELEQEGYRTVLECILRFDATMGSKLFSYLSLAVKWSLINFTSGHNKRAYKETEINDDVCQIEDKPKSPMCGINLACGKCDGEFLIICKKLEKSLYDGITHESDLISSVMDELPHTEGRIKYILSCMRKNCVQ